jgi:hypothetical protein
MRFRMAGGFVPRTAPGAVPLADLKLRGRRDRKPTEPLDFTSAADPRQLQFGVRFNFRIGLRLQIREDAPGQCRER